jgi:hypothetical protein
MFGERHTFRATEPVVADCAYTLCHSQPVRGPILCPQLWCFDVAFDGMQSFLSDDVA